MNLISVFDGGRNRPRVSLEKLGAIATIALGPAVMAAGYQAVEQLQNSAGLVLAGAGSALAVVRGVMDWRRRNRED